MGGGLTIVPSIFGHCFFISCLNHIRIGVSSRLPGICARTIKRLKVLLSHPFHFPVVIFGFVLLEEIDDPSRKGCHSFPHRGNIGVGETFLGRGIDPAMDFTNACSHWDRARHLPAENHNSCQSSLHCSVRQLCI